MNKHVNRADLTPVQEWKDGTCHLAGGHALKPDGSLTLADGSVVVPPAHLETLGNGNVQAGRRELRAFIGAERTGPTFNGPTAKPTGVRLGVPADESALVELLMIDLRENAEIIAPIDDATVLEVIQVGTRLRGGFVGVIDGPDKTPVAVTILHPCKWWWSRGWYYGEVVNFVHPDHRKSRHIDDLMAFGRWIVDEQSKGFGSRVYLLCGVLGTKRFWTKMTLYRRRFVQVGGAFLYPGPFNGERS